MSDYDYMPVVEIIEWLPDMWQPCAMTWLVATTLGYINHPVCEGFVLYHLISGMNLGIFAKTEEAARICLEGLADTGDWSLGSPDLFRGDNAQDLCAKVYGYVDTLMALGCPLEHV